MAPRAIRPPAAARECLDGRIGPASRGREQLKSDPRGRLPRADSIAVVYPPCTRGVGGSNPPQSTIVHTSSVPRARPAPRRLLAVLAGGLVRPARAVPPGADLERGGGREGAFGGMGSGRRRMVPPPCRNRLACLDRPCPAPALCCLVAAHAGGTCGAAGAGRISGTERDFFLRKRRTVHGVRTGASGASSCRAAEHRSCPVMPPAPPCAIPRFDGRAGAAAPPFRRPPVGNATERAAGSARAAALASDCAESGLPRACVQRRPFFPASASAGRLPAPFSVRRQYAARLRQGRMSAAALPCVRKGQCKVRSPALPLPPPATGSPRRREYWRRARPCRPLAAADAWLRGGSDLAQGHPTCPSVRLINDACATRGHV